MEFHEKLQELRKKKGLTQEELAQELYVSRTAISKWESGRGYPSIDSLKAISQFFSIHIDDLLSGETLLSIAETENKSNIKRIHDWIFGIADTMALLLIVLPLYPNTVAGYVYSVTLFTYRETTILNRNIYWCMYLALVLIGIIELLLARLNVSKARKSLTVISMLASTFTVFLLLLTREAYASALAFLLMLIKGMIYLK